MNKRMSRRRFLGKAGMSAAGLLILKETASLRGAAVNEKINVALVGIGGRGRWFLDTIPRMQNVVALCDVDERKLTEEVEAADSYKYLAKTKPKKYRDFRRMLDEMGEQVDAVIVSTPDHTHAVASAAAIRAGKHVFCEKPLTRTVHESRALRELARKYKVATSMGNQGTASGQFRRALELIRDGTIGQIKEVHVWNNAGGADRKQPPGEQPVPDYLDWTCGWGRLPFVPIIASGCIGISGVSSAPVNSATGPATVQTLHLWR